MPFEKAIKKNNDKAMRGDPHSIDRMITPKPEQARLTAEWILPYKEEILADVRELRAQADRALQKDSLMRRRMKKWDIIYPLGFCGEVRNEVLKRIHAELLNKSYPGLQAMRQFVRAGGVLHPVWGIDNGQYFQNAIQVGTAILDVANDTVDKKKEKVVFYPDMQEAPVQRINNFTEFAEVSEKYLHHDIYPNIYLPELAPVFPVLGIRPVRPGVLNGKTLVIEWGAADLLFSSLTTQKDMHLFGPAHDFIFKSPYSEKRLPEDMLESLRSGVMMKYIKKAQPRIFRVSENPEDTQEVFSRFYRDPDIDRYKIHLEEYFDDVFRIGRVGRALKETSIAEVPE